MATALLLCDNHCYSRPWPRGDFAHVCISGLQNFNPRSRSRFSSCWDNHGLVANPPTRNANYPQDIRSDAQEYQSTRTELIVRRCLKLSLIESTVDWIEGSKNPETCVLYPQRFRGRFVGKAGTGIPSQHQPPGLDSIVGIIIPRGTKFEILRRLIIRKDLLHPSVESLGEFFQILGSVESRTPQHPWLWVQ